MKRAGKIIALILMGVIISMNLLTAAGNIAGASGDFSLLPYTLLSVETGSMEPEIHAGDLVIDHEVPFEEIKVGDTVTFEQNGEYITHRVVRFDGSRIVTRGLANNAEDKPFGPDSYLGRVVCVIPGMGRVLRFFSNPWSLLCGIIVLFGIFYGSRIAFWIAGTKKAFSLVRLMSFLLAASFFLLTPTMTAAKYTVMINGTGAVAADSRYIGSNMLSESGSEYLVEGWTGDSYGMTVSVTSGANILKFNRTGQDINYKFYVLKIAGSETETYRTDYSVTVMPQEGITSVGVSASNAFGITEAVQAELETAAEVTEAGPFVLKGYDERITTDNFNILLQGNDAHPLNAGDRIAYKILVVTDSHMGYYRKISGNFLMIISPQQDFIDNQTWSTEAGNVIVNYELTTGLSGGSGARNVRVSWDNTQVYLNEYENNAYEIIHNRGPQYYHPGDENDHNGYLVMSLTAFTSVRLQFFKYDTGLTKEQISFTAALDTGSGTATPSDAAQ